MINSKNDPEMPGKIMAMIAIKPAKKKFNAPGSVSIGVLEVTINAKMELKMSSVK